MAATLPIPATMSSTDAPSAPKAGKVQSQADIVAILKKSGMRALGGGLSGAAAMGINVGALMWLRTTINYQYRNGTTMAVALKTLYKVGGWESGLECIINYTKCVCVCMCMYVCVGVYVYPPT